MWPLAPGWWMLLGLLFLCGLLAYWLMPLWHKRQQKIQMRHNTLELLHQIHQDSLQQADSALGLQSYLQKSNEVFKRLLAQHCPHSPYIAAKGEKWVHFLQKLHLPQSKDHGIYYGDQLYAKRCSEKISLANLHQWACAWVLAFPGKPDMTLSQDSESGD